jgi:hypothetical protein
LQNVVAFYESLQPLDAVVEVVLNLIEVTFIVISYRFGDFTTANTLDIFCSNIQRTDNCIKSIVETNYYLTEITFMPSIVKI